MTTTKELHERRKKVLRGYIGGSDKFQLSTELGVSTRTIERDLEASRDYIDKEMAAKTLTYIFGELQIEAQERRRILKNIVQRQLHKLKDKGKPDDNLLIKTVRALGEEADRVPKYMSQLGLVQNQNIVINQNTLTVQQNKWEQTNIVNMLMAIDKAEEEVQRRKEKVKA